MDTITVTTDLSDYRPASTAIITATGFAVGSTIEFQVLHVLDPGPDGIYGTLDDTIDVVTNSSGDGHDAWQVTDGAWWLIDAGADGIEGTADDVIGGDLDKTANGSITTAWYVNPDDSLGATFLLTATADSDGSGVYGDEVGS